MSAQTTILDWYGCATFRLTIGHLVVFLDAYIDQVPGAPGTGLRADDIDRADWIVIGHSHFDHVWGAERIARNTGATVIGSYETCRILALDGVPSSQLMAVAGGERIRLSDDVVVGVFPSLHSCVWSQTAMTGSDAVCAQPRAVGRRRVRPRAAASDEDPVTVEVSQVGELSAGQPPRTSMFTTSGGHHRGCPRRAIGRHRWHECATTSRPRHPMWRSPARARRTFLAVEIDIGIYPKKSVIMSLFR